MALSSNSLVFLARGDGGNLCLKKMREREREKERRKKKEEEKKEK